MDNRPPTFFERANQWIKTSVTLRLVTIGILVLLMLIPVNMITSLIREREYRQEEAIREVSSKWGTAQTITGPVITVPYTVWNKVQENNSTRLVATREYAHFLPERLDITGEIAPEKRYRGIYEVIVYNGKLNISGQFAEPDFGNWDIAAGDIHWGEAFVQLGVSDLRSLQEHVSIEIDNKSYPFNPGIETSDVTQSGISARIGQDTGESAPAGGHFNVTLNFNGSSNLSFIPMGKVTNVNLKSSWPDPSFSGAFLPDERNVGKDGFTAEWQVLHLNRPYPQEIRGPVHGLFESDFGVDLMVPVDEYQKSMRSAKYAVLFIILTFMMFFFAQILNGVRIHPIQYLLVGFGLCVFYTLLIALSEHIPFSWSYLIASLSIISLITFYVKSIFIRTRVTAFMAMVLGILYLFIYSIIQMEDYALLMGSIGLFIILAVAMALSRKINWYALKAEGGE